jgi:glycerol kinase
MSGKYMLGIDQSTQGTKAVLFDAAGKILGREDLAHNQIINDLGWVEHDPLQIYENTLKVAKTLIEKLNINKSEITGIGLTNQRETAVVWDRVSGLPVYNAIVWQCARGTSICKRLEDSAPMIQARTGLNLSPYFSAAKIAWVLENVEGAKHKSEAGTLACGTMDSWLVYKLTGKQSFKTDYSNASRTQMFNIRELTWDQEICNLFGINTACLAQICDSNADFGKTDLDGFLDQPIPIHSVMGDSHGALFGQRCLSKGMVKATYGTGSSIMMNIGEEPIFSKKGIVTSLAWGIDGKVEYVLEGNINYTGAVISWLKNDLGLIQKASDTEELAYQANPMDKTYLVPAFSGLGAPYWNSNASASICGMSRTTGKAEFAKAALESIAYQIADIVNVMAEESRMGIQELRVDGGPTRNTYLMQFESDILGIPICVPEMEELSVIGAAYMAGISMGLYNAEAVYENHKNTRYFPVMEQQEKQEKYQGWKKAVDMVLYRYR